MRDSNLYNINLVYELESAKQVTLLHHLVVTRLIVFFIFFQRPLWVESLLHWPSHPVAMLYGHVLEIRPGYFRSWLFC